MDILLTDEDIRIELSKLPETDLYLPSAYEETSILWNEFVAKAQLREVVEHLGGLLFKDRYYWHSVQKFLLSEDWEALKEIAGVK